jgi:hypothetical protein
MERKKEKEIFNLKKRYKKRMPRPRKYDYQVDYPDTLFIKLPMNVKKELKEMLSQKEINDLITSFLTEFVENNRK